MNQAADSYPDAKVYGIDLKSLGPAFIPSNLTFILDDLELDWILDEDADPYYIHAGEMTLAIKDWPRLLRQAFQSVHPAELLYLVRVPTLTT